MLETEMSVANCSILALVVIIPQTKPFNGVGSTSILVTGGLIPVAEQRPASV